MRTTTHTSDGHYDYHDHHDHHPHGHHYSHYPQPHFSAPYNPQYHHVPTVIPVSQVAPQQVVQPQPQQESYGQQVQQQPMQQTNMWYHPSGGTWVFWAIGITSLLFVVCLILACVPSNTGVQVGSGVSSALFLVVVVVICLYCFGDICDCHDGHHHHHDDYHDEC